MRAGKIRYYGLSNFTGWQLTKAVHRARQLGLAEPVTLQPQYNLLVREIEWEIVPAVLDAGMGMLPWSPLGGGWLSGKYKRDERPTGATRLGDDPNRGMEAWDRRNNERTWNVIDAVQTVAESRGVSMAEVALAWVTDRPGVTSTIIGARTLEQFETNLRAADLHLDEKEAAALDAASDLHATDYPYGELGVEQRSRKLAGGPLTADRYVGLVTNADLLDLPVTTLSGDATTLGDVTGGRAALARQRRQQVRTDPAVRDARAVARGIRRRRLHRRRLPVQPVRRAGARQRRRDRRVLLDQLRDHLPDEREGRGERSGSRPDLHASSSVTARTSPGTSRSSSSRPTARWSRGSARRPRRTLPRSATQSSHYWKKSGVLRNVREMPRHLDDPTDKQLASLLVADGRSTLKNLAEATGLSVSAVQARVRRLEADGIIRGYQADVDPNALGLAARRDHRDHAARSGARIRHPRAGRRALRDRVLPFRGR